MLIENTKAMVSNNNTDPTPAPPLEGRGEACGQADTNKALQTPPLPLPLKGGERPADSPMRTRR